MSGRRPESDDTQSLVPRNFVRPCVLLLLREGESYGYDLIVRLKSLGMRTDPGGLYRTLRAMERDGLVNSRWETSNAGPARRTYILTADGLDWLHAWAGSLRESRRLLDRFLRRYESIESAVRPAGC